MGPGRAFSVPPAAPSLAVGLLACWVPGAADPEGRAPAHSRPRAACQTGREGSALYGPRDGRKCLVGPAEEAPYMARGGRGRGQARGGDPAREGGRFRRRGPEPQRATPYPATRPAGLLPSGGPRPHPSLLARPPACALGLLCAGATGIGGSRGPRGGGSNPAWTPDPAELDSQLRHAL